MPGLLGSSLEQTGAGSGLLGAGYNAEQAPPGCLWLLCSPPCALLLDFPAVLLCAEGRSGGPGSHAAQCDRNAEPPRCLLSPWLPPQTGDGIPEPLHPKPASPHPQPLPGASHAGFAATASPGLELRVGKGTPASWTGKAPAEPPSQEAGELFQLGVEAWHLGHAPCTVPCTAIGAVSMPWTCQGLVAAALCRCTCAKP